MKINRAKAKDRLPRFADLRPGDTFEYKGQLYMKVWWGNGVFDSRISPMQGTHTAAQLGSGGLVAIAWDEKVKLVDGEFVG